MSSSTSWRFSSVHVLLAGALLLSAERASALSSFQEVRAAYQSSEAILTDRHGVILQQMRVNPRERRLSWIPLDDISPAMRNALLFSEDKRFFQHSGVDWSAVAAAAWGNLWNSRTRGASTITMQLAGLLEEDIRRRSSARTTAQKLSQAWIAQSLEQTWRKDQILEAYLNLVPFRGELLGVHALSRILFEKHPSGLDQIESAIAVALIRAPNASAAKVAERACSILREQRQPDYCQNLEGQTLLAFSKLTSKAGNSIVNHGSDSTPNTANLAPHLARRLLKKDSARVQSTLDAGVQTVARNSLVRQLSSLVDRNVEDGAVVVLDNASGDVLAWVGSSGSLSDASQVDGVLALRQAGSTLKPFLYEIAFEKKLLTAASILDDTPVNLPTANGLYIPQNYDKHFKGMVSARTALASSLNIPAVRTLISVTPSTFFQYLQNLGLGLRESGEYYGYSLALGSADVSLLNLTNAYRTLARQGLFSQPRMTLSAKLDTPKRILNPQASYIVGDILSDRAARALTFGLENALSTRIWTAVKTGTSKDMRDNWCIGYSQRYTVGVWVGNASGEPMWDVSGITGAAPVWQEVMHYLHQRDGQKAYSTSPPLPSDVQVRQIHFSSPIEGDRKELFLTGTEQANITLALSDTIAPKIRYPKTGMVVALDPDIPPDRQKLRLQVTGIHRAMLVLDGKNLSLSTSKTAEPGLHYDWFPWPGKHILSLLDMNGAILDQLTFEVRGAVLSNTAPR
ncbi:penicillin-binding protein 1C [Undibacterium sp. SXout7W]|uniref:penicillin-binding protein 1C n=1 Tax=Undibacterium sp. SXout7W TaxID=3413049 RepID=UPI003BF2955D